MPLQLTSGSFEHNGSIPVRCTSDGAALSPALRWTGIPPGTKSMALIVDDPDAPDPAAPKRVFVHWVLYDMPPATTALPEGAKKAGLPPGTREGRNDGGDVAYVPPSPPIGRHRYFHRLFALDTMLGDLHEPTKAQLEKAMAGHILEQIELIGTYQRQRR